MIGASQHATSFTLQTVISSRLVAVIGAGMLDRPRRPTVGTAHFELVVGTRGAVARCCLPIGTFRVR